jgi:hypothetical protein
VTHLSFTRFETRRRLPESERALATARAAARADKPAHRSRHRLLTAVRGAAAA